MPTPILCQICGDEAGLGGELLPTGALCIVCVDKEPQAPTNNPNEGGGASSAPLPAQTDAPRAAEEQTESKGEPAPPAAGDRAKERRRVRREDIGSYETFGAPPPGSGTVVRLHGRENVLPPVEITGILAEAGDVDVSHLRAFDPPKTREVASIEIEEWIYGALGQLPDLSLLERLVLRRTPFEFHHRADVVAGLEVCRFVVVLEWRASDDSTAPTFREIGPSFQPRMGSRADRASALNTARAWAWNQAKKLKAVGPMSYRQARES